MGDDEVLDEAIQAADRERERLLCGTPEARAVAEAVLDKHLARTGIQCHCGGHFGSSTEVRHLGCEGPCNRTGEQVLALALCGECRFPVCMRCVSKWRG